jgi:Rieske Fe-S protein
MDTTRRTVITAVGVAGAAGAAAMAGGCGSPGGSGTPSPSPSPAGPTGPVALGPAGDIPLRGGKVFQDVKVVVTQPVQGQYKAFSSVCTHMGCQVGTVQNDQIICPCHGSRYSAADGSVIDGPATLALAPRTITVSGGEITLV